MNCWFSESQITCDKSKSKRWNRIWSSFLLWSACRRGHGQTQNKQWYRGQKGCITFQPQNFWTQILFQQTLNYPHLLFIAKYRVHNCCGKLCYGVFKWGMWYVVISIISFLLLLCRFSKASLFVAVSSFLKSIVKYVCNVKQWLT